MQINIESTGALERRLEFGIPNDEVNQKVQKKLNELGRTMRLKGFRPGKVPVKIVQQRYGKQVREEVLQDIMRNGLDQAIEEGDLRVAALKTIAPDEPQGDGEQMKFTAQLEVFPELDDFDVAELSFSKPAITVAASDIDDMLLTLQEQRREWSDVDGGAAAEHRVMVEYVADVDGTRVPEAGKQRIGTMIGSGVVFKEFDDALLGMSKGDSKTVELSFPDDFREDLLAGKKASVELNVKSVQQSELPEVDDEFAASFGITDGGVDKLREEIRNNLEREQRNATRKLLQARVGEKLTEKFADLELPETLVQQDANNTRQRMLQQVQESDGDLSQVPDVEQLVDGARNRVRGSVIFREIARQQSIEVDQQRVQQAIYDIASTYDQPEQVVELYGNNQELFMQVQTGILEEQVIEWVLDHAETTEETMTFKELMRQANG